MSLDILTELDFIDFKALQAREYTLAPSQLTTPPRIDMFRREIHYPDRPDFSLCNIIQGLLKFLATGAFVGDSDQGRLSDPFNQFSLPGTLALSSVRTQQNPNQINESRAFARFSDRNRHLLLGVTSSRGLHRGSDFAATVLAKAFLEHQLEVEPTLNLTIQALQAHFREAVAKLQLQLNNQTYILQIFSADTCFALAEITQPTSGTYRLNTFHSGNVRILVIAQDGTVKFQTLDHTNQGSTLHPLDPNTTNFHNCLYQLYQNASTPYRGLLPSTSSDNRPEQHSLPLSPNDLVLILSGDILRLFPLDDIIALSQSITDPELLIETITATALAKHPPINLNLSAAAYRPSFDLAITPVNGVNLSYLSPHTVMQLPSRRPSETILGRNTLGYFVSELPDDLVEHLQAYDIQITETDETEPHCDFYNRILSLPTNTNTFIRNKQDYIQLLQQIVELYQSGISLGEHAQGCNDSLQNTVRIPGCLAGFSGVGIGREENQDRALIRLLSKTGILLVVADGMGGHDDGAIAAEMLTTAFTQIPPEECIDKALITAIIEKTQNSLPSGNCDTCYSVAHITQDPSGTFELNTFHAGDTRILVFSRDGTVKFRTFDHSLAHEHATRLQDLTPGALDYYESCINSRVSNVITNGLRQYSDRYIEYHTVPLNSGDTILVLSDGVTDNFTPEELAVIFRENPNLQVFIDAIHQRTLERMALSRLPKGSPSVATGIKQDNLTVLACRLPELLPSSHVAAVNERARQLLEE